MSDPVSVEEKKRLEMAKQVLRELRRHAQAWEPDARLLGNLTAYEIAESVRMVLDEEEEMPPCLDEEVVTHGIDCDCCARHALPEEEG